MFDLAIAIIKKTDSPRDSFDSLLDQFPDKRYYNGGVDALQNLEKSPAHLAVIEADTEDISGIEIAEAIRDIDSDGDHFTYIVILGDVPATELEGAFDNIVDAHITNAMRQTLTLVATAGCRLAHLLNTVRSQNSELTHSNLELRNGQLLDPLTGLGNRRFAETSLNSSIRQIESRGGAICFLMISVQNYQETILTYDETIADDLVRLVAEKLQHLVRPMDVVTYFEPGQFALVLVQPSLKECTAECYQRIFDGVRLKSYKTLAGFLPANIAMSICASHAEFGPPNPSKMIKLAQENLNKAIREDSIIVHHLTSTE